MVKVKGFIDWLLQRSGQQAENTDLIESLQDELQGILRFIKNTHKDWGKQGTPLLKTLLLSEMEHPVYQQSAEALNTFKPEKKKHIVECYAQIERLHHQYKLHNELFEKFVQLYIKNGLPLTGIQYYDPSKKTAYQEVNAQYELVLQNSKSLEEQYKHTCLVIEQTLDQLVLKKTKA